VDSAAGDAVTFLDVCQLKGVSQRTLQASFEKILGMSPSK
jgi:transcriptional regulator GlxA family with amidase domain